MNGSPKQIAWAQDILGTARAAAEKIAAAIAAVTGGTPEQQERRQLIIDRLLTEYRETNARWASAKDVIDRKDTLTAGFIIASVTMHGRTAADRAAIQAKREDLEAARRATLPKVDGALNVMVSPLLGWTPDEVTGATTKISFDGQAFWMRAVKPHGNGFVGAVDNDLSCDDEVASCGVAYGASIYFETGFAPAPVDFYAADEFGTDLLGRDDGWMQRLRDASGVAA